MNYFKNKSWKTTGAGLAAIFSVLGPLLTALTDGKPETNPNWSVDLPIIFGSLGLIFARDNDKSSESVGAKPVAGVAEDQGGKT